MDEHFCFVGKTRSLLGKLILGNVDSSPLEVIVVHGLDGLIGRLLRLKTHSSHALGATIRTHEDVSTDNGANFPKQVLQVLPRGSVRKVTDKDLTVSTRSLNNGAG